MGPGLRRAKGGKPMTESNQLMPRRAFLALAAGAAALPAFSAACAALDYPTRTVRIICGFVAGQIPDVVARMVALRYFFISPARLTARMAHGNAERLLGV